jgi:hypothetical protein
MDKLTAYIPPEQANKWNELAYYSVNEQKGIPAVISYD